MCLFICGLMTKTIGKLSWLPKDRNAGRRITRADPLRPVLEVGIGTRAGPNNAQAGQTAAIVCRVLVIVAWAV